MTIGDAEDRQQISLVLDALFLACELTERCRRDADWLEVLESSDKKDRILLARLQRTLEVTKKAWKRYNRRAGVVEGLDQMPLV